uniref:Uncharacterized protein n=2 Tax=Picea TaxID=3328 RepID=A0A101M3X4_PICGL|nr:hypothetical protein ABT39_MTgene346 [Picea glauca]QHR90149.1 hypothetical protein Q903MT_gene4172 [Picea sitchensis]
MLSDAYWLFDGMLLEIETCILFFYSPVLSSIRLMMLEPSQDEISSILHM